VTTLTPPSEAPPERPARAGFSLPLDIVIAPGRAFTKIAKTSEWLPALSVIVALGLVTSMLFTPAILHIAIASGPRPAHPLTPAETRTTQSQIMFGLGARAVLIPLMMAALTAAPLTIAARFSDPQAPYVRFFALATNCLVPSALGDLAHAIAVAIHPASSFHDIRSLQLALPDNLGIFAAPGNDRELDFLSHFDIGDAWSFILIAFGFSLFANVRFTTALILAFAMDFVYAFLFD
jgi:hypothetical protein